MKDNIITYRGRKFEIIENKLIPSTLLCDYCDFKELCYDYIDEELWMACNAVFGDNHSYLIEHKK